MAVIEGICNFSHVTKHDVYNGQDTGKFSMTITLSENDAAELKTDWQYSEQGQWVHASGLQ